MGLCFMRMTGGLGNQLSQYGFLREIKRRFGCRVAMDTFDWTHRKHHDGGHYIKHRFCIDRLRVVTDPVTEEERFHALSKSPWLVERNFHFQDMAVEEMRPILEQDVVVFVDGYFSDFRYHEGVIGELRGGLYDGFAFDDYTRRVLEGVEETESVSVHFRRGDYLRTKDVLVLGRDYYRPAIDHVVERRENVVFFLFSDEPQAFLGSRWPFPVVLVEEEGRSPADRNVEDLYLMSRCKSHIIANSSFSWWGARLDGRGGIVVAPKIAYKEDNADMLEKYGEVLQPFYPPGWVTK